MKDFHHGILTHYLIDNLNVNLIMRRAFVEDIREQLQRQWQKNKRANFTISLSESDNNEPSGENRRSLVAKQFNGWNLNIKRQSARRSANCIKSPAWRTPIWEFRKTTLCLS